MKTPRKILFEQHESADAKLDAMRNDFMAEHVLSETRPLTHSFAEPMVGRPTLSPDGGEGEDAPSFVQKLWQELVLPYRRVWMGLAAAWLIIIVMNFISPAENPRTVGGTMAEAASPSPEVTAVLKEQKQMMAQLLEPTVAAPAPRTVPAPRSQRGQPSVAA